MSDSAASSGTSSPSYTSSTTETISTIGADTPYSCSGCSTYTGPIATMGGMDAADTLYSPPITDDIYAEINSDPIVQGAIDKYRDNAMDADAIYDTLNGIYSSSNLPNNVAGVTQTQFDKNPYTGEITNIHSDIFYDGKLPINLQYETLLHELGHVEQQKYSQNMNLAFSEGDATLHSKYLSQQTPYSYLTDNNEKLYTSDPIYDMCEDLVTDIYKQIGNGDAEEGRKTFYDALKGYDGDFNKALDSFNSELSDLTEIYAELNDLTSIIENSQQPYNLSDPINAPYDTLVHPDPLTPVSPLIDSYPKDGIFGYDTPLMPNFDTSTDPSLPINEAPINPLGALYSDDRFDPMKYFHEQEENLRRFLEAQYGNMK